MLEDVTMENEPTDLLLGVEAHDEKNAVKGRYRNRVVPEWLGFRIDTARGQIIIVKFVVRARWHTLIASM
jgi:hypothetical protein